jgi:peptidyl-prolyl cis-trans isomerase D
MWRLKDKTLHGIEADKLKRNAGIYTILITALVAMTFFGVCDPRSAQRLGPKGAAATVAGDAISRFEFQRAYRNAYERYQRMYADAFDPAAMRLSQSVMRQLVDERGLYHWSRTVGLQSSEDEVLDVLTKEDVFKGEDGRFSEERFSSFLQNQGYTEASFLEEVRRGLTMQKLRRFVAETTFVSAKAAELEYRLSETKLNLNYVKLDPQQVKVQVSSTDVDQFLANEKEKQRVKEYYDQNTKEFNQPEQVRARHILIAFKGARNASPQAAAREKEVARKLAQEALAKLKAGQDFAVLAKAMTDEPVGKTSGGDLGLFTRDKMDKIFSDAAFALAAGQISEIVETPFGYHIIKTEQKVSAVEKSFESAQRQIAESLIAKEKKPAVAKEEADRLVAELTAGRPVEALLTQYGVAWAETGEINGEARYLPGIGSSSDVGDALGKLGKPGQIYPAPVNVRGNLFILKLKSKVEPDLKGLDAAKVRELRLMASYTDGNSRFGDFEKDVRKNLEKNHDIWMNPEYLTMDDKSSKAGGGESGE